MRRKLIDIWRCWVLCIIGLLFVQAAKAQVYDANLQFDTMHNPASVGGWSYGYTATLGGTFSLLNHQFLNSNWAGWVLLSNGDIAIMKNVRGSGWNPGGDGFVPQDSLSLTPANGNQYTVVRWTAPDSGIYMLETEFTGVYNNGVGTNADIHILKNNLTVFSDFIIYRSHISNSQSISLLAGDTIDYALGRGSDNTYSWDRVILDARITKSNLIAPTNLTVTPVSSTKLRLDWQHDGQGIDGFKIERKTGGINDQQDYHEVKTITDPTALTWVDEGADRNPPGLAPYQTYTYQIRAFKASANSDYSQPAEGMTYATVTVTRLAKGRIERSKVVNGEIIPTAEYGRKFYWGWVTTYDGYLQYDMNGERSFDPRQCWEAQDVVLPGIYSGVDKRYKGFPAIHLTDAPILAPGNSTIYIHRNKPGGNGFNDSDGDPWTTGCIVFLEQYITELVNENNLMQPRQSKIEIINAFPALTADDYSISGTVRDQFGKKGLPGVRVVVKSMAGDPTNLEAITDTQGHYLIIGLLPGAYLVQPIAQGKQFRGAIQSPRLPWLDRSFATTIFGDSFMINTGRPGYPCPPDCYGIDFQQVISLPRRR